MQGPHREPVPDRLRADAPGDGVKRALDAAGYPYEDLVATGDQGQNLSLISAALQADDSICGIVGLGNPAANPAAQYVGENGLDIPVATFDVGAEAAKRIQDGTLTMAINQQPFLQSYFAVANMVNQAKYSLSPVNVDTGTSIVTNENIKTRAGVHRRRSLLTWVAGSGRLLRSTARAATSSL